MNNIYKSGEAMNKEYKDDPEYQKMVQAVLDANKIISKKKIMHYIIYFVIMLVLIIGAVLIVWNVLGLKELFKTYESILGQ